MGEGQEPQSSGHGSSDGLVLTRIIAPQTDVNSSLTTYHRNAFDRSDCLHGLAVSPPQITIIICDVLEAFRAGQSLAPAPPLIAPAPSGGAGSLVSSGQGLLTTASQRDHSRCGSQSSGGFNLRLLLFAHRAFMPWRLQARFRDPSIRSRPLIRTPPPFASPGGSCRCAAGEPEPSSGTAFLLCDGIIVGRIQ